MTTPSGGVANLKEQIKVRGLTIRSGFKDTPLTHFKGTLSLWDAHIEKATTAGWSDRTMVRLQFDNNDLEVIHSDSPYTHPNAAIQIPYSENGIRADGQGNSWAFFVESAKRLFPEDQGMDALLLQHLEIQWRDTYYDGEGNVLEVLIYNSDAKKAILRQTWIIVGANGENWSGGVNPNAPTAVGTQPEDILTTMANAIDGKDKNEANAKLIKIPAVRDNRMADVMNGKVYEELVAAQLVTVDDAGVYHKV